MNEPTEPTCANCRRSRPYRPGCVVAMACRNSKSTNYGYMVHSADTCYQHEPAEKDQQ